VKRACEPTRAHTPDPTGVRMKGFDGRCGGEEEGRTTAARARRRGRKDGKRDTRRATDRYCAQPPRRSRPHTTGYLVGLQLLPRQMRISLRQPKRAAAGTWCFTTTQGPPPRSRIGNAQCGLARHPVLGGQGCSGKATLSHGGRERGPSRCSPLPLPPLPLPLSLSLSLSRALVTTALSATGLVFVHRTRSSLWCGCGVRSIVRSRLSTTGRAGTGCRRPTLRHAISSPLHRGTDHQSRR